MGEEPSQQTRFLLFYWNDVVVVLVVVANSSDDDDVDRDKQAPERNSFNHVTWHLHGGQ